MTLNHVYLEQGMHNQQVLAGLAIHAEGLAVVPDAPWPW